MTVEARRPESSPGKCGDGTGASLIRRERLCRLVEPELVELDVIAEMQGLGDELLHRQVRYIGVRADERYHPGDQQDKRLVHADDRHAMVRLEVLGGGSLQHVGYAIGNPVKKANVQRGVAVLDQAVRERTFIHDQRADELDEIVQRTVDVARLARGVPLLHSRENIADYIVEDRVCHFILIGKIVVEQGTRHMRPVRDVADGDFGKALFGAYVTCRAHDGCAPGVALPAGRWGFTGTHSSSVRDAAQHAAAWVMLWCWRARVSTVDMLRPSLR